MQQDSPPLEPVRRESAPAGARSWFGPLVVSLVAVAMAAWTWRKWAEPIIDFGGEAYVAWRISEGDVLYRDLAYFTGPLAPYLHGLAMRAFGTSLTTIAGVNLVLLAGSLALLYRLAVRLSDRFAATCACVAFVVLCAFGLHKGGGNYNFVWPYSQEMPLGTFLCLAALTLGRRWLERPTRTTALGIGLLFGLVFLTKVEFSLALGAALVVALAIGPAGGPRRLEHAGLALAASLLPFAAAGALLASQMPAGSALHGALGAWPHALEGDASNFPLYRMSMGIEPLGFHLTRIAAWGAGIVAVFALTSWLALRKGALVGGGVAVAIAASTFAALPWGDALYPISLLAFGALVHTWRRRALDPSGPLRVVWCAFALLLMLRMALNGRVEFYGFALAAPALVLLVIALTGWLPERFPEQRAALRAATLPLFAVLVLGHMLPMARYLRANTLEIGRGGDRMVTSPRGTYLQEVIDLVAERCPPDGTVLVLPEGALVNYATRRRAPTRFFNHMPPELAMFGEETVLAELERAPPDLVVLVHRDTTEYGLPFFGRDYGAALYRWVRERYRPVKLWSLDPKEKPLEPGTRHAMAVLERRR